MSSKHKKEMEVTPNVVTKNFSKELQDALKFYKGEPHVQTAIIDAIINEKVKGIEKKIDPKSGEDIYTFAKGKEEKVKDSFELIAMDAERKRIASTLKVEEKIKKFGDTAKKVLAGYENKNEEIKYALGGVRDKGFETETGHGTGESLVKLKEFMSEDVLKLVDSLNYSSEERREIYKAIRKNEIPGIKMKKTDIGPPVYDFVGTKETSREAYREVAFNGMENVVKKYHKSELAKSGF